MNIEVINLGKRFNRDWIFKNLNFEIEVGERLAIVGRNGAGKSTLLKILGGYLPQTRGDIKYLKKSEVLETEDIQLEMNFVAPYFNLIEEYTLAELLLFHSNFKKPILNLNQLLKDCDLSKDTNKFIKDYSSGMKQRVKLMLAFGFDSKILLLDEPTSNLDERGINWFKKMVLESKEDKTIIIASNLKEEIKLCSKSVEINKF